MGEMGKDLCPSFLQTFLDCFDRRSCHFFSISQPSLSVVALSLEYHIDVPSKTASIGREIMLRSLSKRPVNMLNALIR